ncbi:MAG: universal stress protein [Cyanobacterium sp. T60_A2020_053]|nr:universal stress protein [Cyanobacterium sp. T60_A2020_053]
MKSILLCTDGSDFAENIYRYGAWFAKKLDSKLNVLSVTDIRSQQVVSTNNFSGTLNLGTSQKLLEKLVEIEHQKAHLNHEKSKLILQAAANFLHQEDITNISLINKTGFLVDVLHEFETENDLIILGKRGDNAQFASNHLGANVERILRSSHKPCCVIPREFKPVESLLLAYDGGASCQKLISFMASFPIFQDLELHLITVAQNNHDQNAKASFAEGKELATKAGFNPIAVLKEGHPEDAIAQYIAEHDISMLLMGAYGHSRIRQLVIGSVTAQILRATDIATFVFR